MVDVNDGGPPGWAAFGSARAVAPQAAERQPHASTVLRNLRSKAGADADTSTFKICYNLSLSPVSQPVPIGSNHRFARAPAALEIRLRGAAIVGYQWRRSGPPANTVRIQAIIFQISWSLSISSPNGGIGPTTPSEPLRT